MCIRLKVPVALIHRSLLLLTCFFEPDLKSKIYYCFSESEEFDFIEKKVMSAYIETRNEKGVCEFEVVKYF